MIPLWIVHPVGGALGALVWRCSAKYRRKMAENLAQAGYDSDAYSPAVSRELGKQAAETAWIWGKPRKALMKHVSATAEAERIIGDALASGRPILFITPHIGSFEVAPVWLAERFLAGTDRYMAILYRIPKKSILQNVCCMAAKPPVSGRPPQR